MRKQIRQMDMRKVGAMRTIGNWNRLIMKARKQQAKHEKINRMIVLGRGRVFSARIVRRNKNIPKWTRLLRGLYAQAGEGGQRYLDTFQTATIVSKLSLKNEKMGRLAVARKWADMVRKLIWLRNSERRSLRASINLRRMAMKLLRRNSGRPALKKWRFIAERVLNIVRNDQS